MSPRRSGGVLKEHAGFLNVTLHVIDWFIVAFCGWLSHWLYLGVPSLDDHYEAALLIGALLAALVFQRFNLYRPWRGASLWEELRLITAAWVFVFTALVAIAFFTKMGESYSRGWALIWATSTWFVLLASRFILRNILNSLRARGYNYRRIVIVGATGAGRQVAERIKAAPWLGLKIIGFFCDREGLKGTSPCGYPMLGRVSELAEFVRKEDVDQIWIAMPLQEADRLQDVLHSLRNETVDIRFVPDLFGLRLLNHSVTDVAGLPVMNLSVSPMEGVNRFVKAIEDRVLSLLILILISPLLVAIAIGVKLSSPGPVLFKQKRHGWDGREIRVYKFRSMVLHQEADGQVTQASKADPRVTRFGAFLRRTSLDELPQFFNVLQGRMSIVGPRPHALAHNEYYKEHIDYYMLRHKVKPGITGWAQVNGYRGETDTLEKMQKRVEYDLYYIENWSLWFDLKIIFLTVFKGFVGRNAY
ncbi:Undecaprenyl-phosphate galactose phosphotransferase [Thioalkalivibrio sulfidiphilus HL-EbGr7]|uniref:Undecaprenyl-phosphate galactose phosphotransferase n=1 Tax=Thioalkalivibrio sulfidiphilus (strain HL-EbGR7) TaxID=396588 RepID=B8GTR9_THISH|nr:undecaprenyl-phosphate glucose phosphotransferase [Thioalkalivibrio sulfidiphilus]ACL73163.1 Undecaprenyl-phosphate galactose phosphotransferase [Thioalkalivibrio sulfidiphilus HL-EbGr7]